VTAVAGLGIVLGAAAFRSGHVGMRDDLPAYAAGIVLAAGSSLGGLALLRRRMRSGGRAFAGLLLGLFLGRVALVGAFGLALSVVAPAHLVSGLLSLVGFHFIFAVLEIVLLARTGAAGQGTGQPA
jgi:hypothetical protein